jgi:simple sugar transport system permease protein
VVNLALEAMLLAGAFGGAIGAQAAGGVLAGVALGLASGALVAAGLAWLAVFVRTDQFIACLALTIALVVVAWVLHERSVVGLRVAAIGEHPEAAETVGLSVRRHRALAVVASGLIAGLGGAYLALNVGQFQPGMSAGKGYIALAAVVFGRWRPLGATLACLGFAAAEAATAALERASLPFPRELLGALPYVLTIVAVAGLVGRARAPGALGRPYPAA